MKLKIRGFEWDDGNIHKCQKHGLSIAEIESFFHYGNFVVAPDLRHSASERRLFAVGKTKYGKPVLAVFVERSGLIRPVSVRYMHQKEWKKYEEKSSSFQN